MSDDAIFKTCLPRDTPPAVAGRILLRARRADARWPLARHQLHRQTRLVFTVTAYMRPSPPINNRRTRHMADE